MLTFRYVLAGWEGSSHDGAVLEAAFDAGFVVPTGKYYLGDAGFSLTPWCLTPYRGVRYHLREWSKTCNNRYNMKWTQLIVTVVHKIIKNYTTCDTPRYAMQLNEFSEF